MADISQLHTIFRTYMLMVHWSQAEGHKKINSIEYYLVW